MGFLTSSSFPVKSNQSKAILAAAAVWGLYCAILLVLIPRHEPWFDEAQAWLIARDARPTDLVWRYLRYEGSPGLWHLILTIPAKFGAPYASLNYISGTAGAAAMALLLYKSPFPSVLKLTLPFTYFLLYQYAVVARSYALIPLLLFSIALIYRNAERRTFWLLGLLVLLANVSLHGFVLAFSVFATYLWESRRSWASWDTAMRRRHAVACATMVAVALLLAAQLRPPNDLLGYGTMNFSVRHLLVVSVLKVGAAFTGSLWLSLAVFLISCWWFWKTQTLLMFLVGTAALSAVAGIVYSHVWHEGLLLVFWLFSLWLSFERSHSGSRPIPALVLSSVLVVIAIQIFWTASTARFDFSYPYSGSRELAQYLRGNGLDQGSVFGFGFKSISLLPYFSTNLFSNYHDGQLPAFWLWSKENDMDRNIDRLSLVRPRSVIVSVTGDSDVGVGAVRQKLQESGYRFVRRFDGALFWKTQILENDAYELWAPADSTREGHSPATSSSIPQLPNSMRVRARA